MRLSDYLPKLYEKNVEMNNIIDSEEVETEKLKNDIENSFNNTFIDKANIEGIIQFESILDIISGDSVPIEIRRQYVQSRLALSPPFTEKTMIDYINKLIGENNWYYTMDYDTHKLDIFITTPEDFAYVELLHFVADIIPLNMDVTIQLYAVSWDYVASKFNTWGDITEMTWQEILDGDY